MKAILLVALQLSFFGANLFAQTTQFPYQAIVVSAEAHVQSGPGKMHYATDVLKPGDIVQVYEHDPGNWCAIRPPEGSFSLVPEAAISLVNENEGEVVEANTQAWVGTAMGAVEKPLWQVKLKVGEMVKILGEVSWPDADGNETVWFQIAPPNGEFRWIHLDDIQLPKRELPGEFEQHESSSPLEVSGEFESYEQRNEGWRPAKIPFEEQQQSEVQLASAQEEHRQGAQNLQASPVGVFVEQPNDQGFITPKPRPQRFENANQDRRIDPAPLDRATRPLGNGLPDRYASRDSAFGAIPPGQSIASSSMTPIAPLGTPLTERLRQLDLRLSKEVTKPSMMDWSLSDVAIDTQSVINNAVTDSERMLGQRLLEKINNFRRIQDNARTVEGSRRSLEGTPFTLEQPNTQAQTSIYDAEGWLNELVLNRGTVNSTYVLEDDQGRITHHVQAAPGLNLHRYLRSKIGIVGQRGYHQQLELNHILVERLIVLEKAK